MKGSGTVEEKGARRWKAESRAECKRGSGDGTRPSKERWIECQGDGEATREDMNKGARAA